MITLLFDPVSSFLAACQRLYPLHCAEKANYVTSLKLPIRKVCAVQMPSCSFVDIVDLFSDMITQALRI